MTAVCETNHRPTPAAHVIVPVRSLTDGKRRLAGTLPQPARQRLVVALLTHVLEVLGGHPRVRSLTIASPDLDVRTWARAHGVACRLCTGHDLNADVVEAMAAVVEPCARVLVVHADLPHLDARAIDRVLDAHADVVVARSSDGGTNLLALPHPAACPPRFGADSARAHACAARERDFSFQIVDDVALAFDIDTLDDACVWIGAGPTVVAGVLAERLAAGTIA